MPSILVVTTVHHPGDARIRYRQIETLLRKGWRVTYAAPFRGYGLDTREQVAPGLSVINLPRAVGRRRLAGLRSAHQLLKHRAGEFDLVLLHDPELLISYIGAGATNVVLDVHEDPAAAIEAKEWIPRLARHPIFAAVRGFEAWAEKRMPLLLAEYKYQERFQHHHPVVPNAVRVPQTRPTPGRDRVVYLGALTMERGAQEVVDVATILGEQEHPLTVEVIGQAHGQARELITQAHKDGVVRWHGFVPSAQALPMLDGALVGLSLLHDMPNYRHSMPTKILEYMAHGLPIITTPLPVARDVVETAGSGTVVPFKEPAAVAAEILRLRANPSVVEDFSRRGFSAVKQHYDWTALGNEFNTTMMGLIK